MRASTPKAWVLRSPAAPERAQELAVQLGISHTFATLLANRGFCSSSDVQSFLEPNLDKLLDAFTMRDMDLAAARIWKAIDERESILVYGDYDVDGITATSLLTAALQRLGGKVSYFIPDRIRDGYGFSVRGVDVAKKRRIRLVITADCGITATTEVKLAKQHGIDVIVTDHHEPLGVLPEAHAVVNPKRRDCPYEFKELAGVGVVLKLVQGLAQYRPGSLPADFVYDHLDLVALGTIADVVPLRGENRIFAKLGLEAFGEVGDPFDPAIHEAVMHAESDEVSEPTSTTVSSGLIRIEVYSTNEFRIFEGILGSASQLPEP